MPRKGLPFRLTSLCVALLLPTLAHGQAAVAPHAPDGHSFERIQSVSILPKTNAPFTATVVTVWTRLLEDGTQLQVSYTLTRAQPPGWTGYRRRIDADVLREVAWPPDEDPLVFVCGPTPFVESAAANLVALGYEPERIKTERFGPTGEA